MPNGQTADPRDPDHGGKPAVPDYELIRIIGRGSYGDVWLGRGVTGIYRAIKVIWRSRFPDTRPYEREFKGLTEFAAVSLTESRQLALLHVGRPPSAEYFYYVMELADDAETGTEIVPETYVPLTLRRLRDRRGRLPAAECTTLGVELSRALSGLHSRKLVHRDIKPSNVIFVGGVPKLADIGLVAAMSESQTFIGTEGFVPPEGPGAPSADVYALGKLLYEVSTGLDRNEYPRLPGNLSEIPDRQLLLELNEVIVKACHPVAAQRHADAAGLLSELLLVQAGKSMRRLRTAERQLGRALRLASVLGVIAVVAAMGAWFERTRLRLETTRRLEAEASLEALARESLYSSNLNRAQRALETGDLGLAKRVLAELRPEPGQGDLRGFEWHALWNQAQGDSAAVVHNPERGKLGLFLSTDGSMVAGWTDDAHAAVWKAGDLGLLMPIAGIRDLAGFSADGRWLLGTNAHGKLCRWSTSSGAAEPSEKSPDEPLKPLGALGDTSAAFLLLSAQRQPKSLGTWDFTSGSVSRLLKVQTPEQDSWAFASFSLSHTGERCALSLYSTGSNSLWHLQVYDLRGGALLYDHETTDRISRLALSWDGKRVAYALADSSKVCVDTVDTGAPNWQRNVGMGIVSTLAFSPDAARIAIGGRTSPVRIVDSTDGSITDSLSGQEADVSNIVWNPVQRRIYSIGYAGDLRYWQEDGARKPHVFHGFYSESFGTQCVSVSDDGADFAAPVSEKAITWGRVDSVLPVAADVPGFIPLGFDPDSQGLTTLSRDGTLFHLRKSGQHSVQIESRRDLQTGERAFDYADWSSDHRILALVGRSGTIYFMDTKRGTASKFSGSGVESIGWVSLSKDGNTAVSGGIDNTVRLLHTASGDVFWTAVYNSLPFQAVFAPDGKSFALCLRNGEVELRETRSGALARRFRSDITHLESIAYSPGGDRLFLGGSSGSVQVLRTQDLHPLVTLGFSEGNGIGDQTIAHLAMSASGRTLMAYRGDGWLAGWSTDGPGP